ncbi:MAG TPA: PEP/pyruvate-binding domain-containing protein [Acidimicrobiales bacterium]|nr:PEP/pyruvate-binding domain-containing protein [Acidimicrobiales bacterium]
MSQLHVAAPASKAVPLVQATVDCYPEQVAEVGGKAVGLGRLLRAGQPVPASFTVTAAAYRQFVAGGADEVPAAVIEAIAEGYAELCERRRATIPVAVRSSASVEDSDEASCAGQFKTFLGARGVAQVVGEIRACWLSAFDPHVDAYRAERSGAAGDAQVAVVVQELVDARAAGVMFTQHPRSGDRSLVVIEASYGLGEAVVGGEVVPDLFEINKITRQVVKRSMGQKSHEYRLHTDGDQVERREVDAARASRWAIDDGHVAALAEMAAELESALGPGLDTEWALGSVAGSADEASLFALQVRPITTDPRARLGPPGTTAAAAAARPPAAASAVDLILGRLSGPGPALP